MRIPKRTENVGVLGWVFWSIFSAVWSSHFGPIVVVMPIEVTPFVWFTLAMAGLTFFAARNWDWAYARTTRGKLGLVLVELRTLRRILLDYAEREELKAITLRPVIKHGISESLVAASLESMATILDQHDIPHPNPDAWEEWLVFVARLEPIVRDSWTMKKARRVYGESN